jgi:chemotaxis protein methyltransferase WspC
VNERAPEKQRDLINMSDTRIESILRQEVGLDNRFLSGERLQRTVMQRMEVLGFSDRDAYFAKLRSSAEELDKLIEEIVIPETFFFRERAPFEAMLRHLDSCWEKTHASRTMNLLSVPCATGEEPYSLAMVLTEAGVAPERFAIHGIDISSRLIARAREGVYAKNSFRGKDISYRDRFFTADGKFYNLIPAIREKVRFHAGNVLHTPFMESLGLFDVIFFRNVLIYFDADAIKRAMANLNRILAVDGLLFVGHAEANLVDTSFFSHAPHIQAFAFHKKNSSPRALQPAEPVAAAPPVQKDRSRGGKAKPSTANGAQQEPDLLRAQQLADRGELDRAAVLCKEHLQQCGPSAAAFFLLGIISENTGDPERAETFYRKALYLEPHNKEILLFLSLLTEMKGDREEAAILAKRLKRLQEK